MGELASKLEVAELWLVDVGSGKSYALRDGFVVGRGAGDLPLSDASVSTRHCIFHVRGRTIELEDLGSRNGTFVGGQQIEPKMRLALLPGARLEIGHHTFEIRVGGEPEAAEEQGKPMMVELSSYGEQLQAKPGAPADPGSWSGAAVPPVATHRSGNVATRTMSMPQLPEKLETISESQSGTWKLIGLVLLAVVGWLYVHNGAQVKRFFDKALPNISNDNGASASALSKTALDLPAAPANSPAPTATGGTGDPAAAPKAVEPLLIAPEAAGK